MALCVVNIPLNVLFGSVKLILKLTIVIIVFFKVATRIAIVSVRTIFMHLVETELNTKMLLSNIPSVLFFSGTIE